MKIQHIRNATIKLYYDGLTFLIDPYFADKHTQPSFVGKSLNPTVDLPLPLEDIMGGVDYVLISHLHPDHFDEKAQGYIPKETKILCQPSDAPTIQNMGFEDVTPLHDTVLLNSIEITRTDGQHGSGEILPFMGKVSGFVFKASNERSLYWTGDTIYTSTVQQNIFKHKPSIIICHGGANKFKSSYPIFGDSPQNDTESVVMDGEQIVTMSSFFQDGPIIVTHIGALDHETTTRQELSDYMNHFAIHPERIIVPIDGQILDF